MESLSNRFLNPTEENCKAGDLPVTIQRNPTCRYFLRGVHQPIFQIIKRKKNIRIRQY